MADPNHQNHDGGHDDDGQLDPSLVGDGASSQLPSASAAHELAEALNDGGDGGSHTLPQAFWDALPLGDTMHDQGRQTSSSSHTPTMEDLHAVMSHDPHPHPYGHPDESAHYDPFDPPQSAPSSLPRSASQLHGHQQDEQAHASGSGSQQHQHSQSAVQGAHVHGHDPSQLGQQQEQPPAFQSQESMSGLGVDGMGLLAPSGDLSRSGSPEPKLSRKETHKMVERRRREVITKGINEIADLLPVQEKNKSLILGKAVDYIRQLKRTEVANLEKWSMEKALMQQAMSDLRGMLEDERGKRRDLEQTLHGIGRSAGLSGYDEAGDASEEQQRPANSSAAGDGRETQTAEDGKRGADVDDKDDGAGPDAAVKRQRVS